MSLNILPLSASGGGGGDAVQGASNLTTSGAIPYVSAPGVLSQDPTYLFWDTTDKVLGLGTNNPTHWLSIDARAPVGTLLEITGIDVINNTFGGYYMGLCQANAYNYYGYVFAGLGDNQFGGYNEFVQSRSTDGVNYGAALDNDIVGNFNFEVDIGSGLRRCAAHFVEKVGNASISNWTGRHVWLTTNGTTGVRKMTLTPPGNLIIGQSSTDNNYKFDVIDSGSAGTARFKDLTATTGATSVLIDIGAGQTAASTVLTLSGVLRYNGTNTTGAGSALLGSNSPASTLSAPYTWFKFVSSDGSTVYVPAWK